MKRVVLALLCTWPLYGCGITAAIQGAGQQLGPAVNAIDSDIYAVALAKYQAAQMFKAQVDGQLTLAPLPPPASASGTMSPSLPTPSVSVPVVVMGTPLASAPGGALPLGPTGR